METHVVGPAVRAVTQMLPSGCGFCCPPLAALVTVPLMLPAPEVKLASAVVVPTATPVAPARVVEPAGVAVDHWFW